MTHRWQFLLAEPPLPPEQALCLALLPALLLWIITGNGIDTVSTLALITLNGLMIQSALRFICKRPIWKLPHSGMNLYCIWLILLILPQDFPIQDILAITSLCVLLCGYSELQRYRPPAVFHPAALICALWAAIFPERFHSTMAVSAHNLPFCCAIVAGGLFLCWKRIIPWRPCIVSAASLFVLTLCVPLLPVTHPATMLSVQPLTWLFIFFLLPDPRTRPHSWHHQCGMGLLGILLIFALSSAAVSSLSPVFVILLVNSITPLLNRLHGGLRVQPPTHRV